MPSKTRNIGIIAHIDAGKTTVTERLLYYSGRIHKMGTVDEGNTQMDWMDQEQERGITITSAATTLTWHDYTITIIDTPGHVDFTAEVERSLRVLDGAVGVFCAVAGVQPQSETVWHQAEHYRVPRLAIVNKMDRMGASFTRAVADLQRKLSPLACPVQLPWGQESHFTGIFDLVTLKATRWDDELGAAFHDEEIPEAYLPEVLQYRQKLIEAVVEQDDVLLNRYLEGEEIGAEDLKRLIRSAVLNLSLFPVFCGSALKNRGMQPLLDAVVDYLPSPDELPPVEGQDPKTGEVMVRARSVEEPFTALAFKIMSEEGKGRLTYLRVYAGELKAGAAARNIAKGTFVKLPNLVKLHANKRERVETVGAGEIVAALNLKGVATGDTLGMVGSEMLLEAMQFPEPVISVAIEPGTIADQEKLTSALQELQEEDPTFRAKVDIDTGQTVISGMGELHLDVLAERIQRQFHVRVRVGNPQVAFRETITQAVERSETLQKVLGQKEVFASVTLRLEPAPRGTGFRFEDSFHPEVEFPAVFREAVRKSAQEALGYGIRFGYPILDVKVVLLGAKWNAESSTELAFHVVTVQCFREACQGAASQVLEPSVAVEVTTPEEFLGEVLGNLTARGGIVQEMKDQPPVKIIKAEAPLSQMFGYTTGLRSITHGRASFTMQPTGYQPADPVRFPQFAG